MLLKKYLRTVSSRGPKFALLQDQRITKIFEFFSAYFSFKIRDLKLSNPGMIYVNL